MAEQLFRRGADGTMETVVPQAQGKAAALSSYLAQGGTPFQMSGKYKQGRMKGKTMDQATADFERMWASSPDELKQKYANRSSGAVTDLAPSERVAGMTPAPSTNASLNAARPGETPAQMVARQRASRMGTTPTTPAPAKPYDKDANGIPDMIQRPAGQSVATQTTPTPAASVTPPSNSFAPGSDAARAAALTENSQNERLATATVGNYADMQAAVAMENQSSTAPQTMNAIGDDGNIKAPKLVVGVNPAPVVSESMKASLESARNAQEGTRNAQEGTRKAQSGETNLRIPTIPGGQASMKASQETVAENPVQTPPSMAQSQQSTREAIAATPTQAAPTPVVAQSAPAVAPPASAKAKSDADYGAIADQRKAQGYPAIGTPSRIGATPAGMELTGMKGGVPQYTPIAEVYGAPKTASIQTSGGRITGSTRQTDEQQRAGYQRSQSQQPDMTARVATPPRAIPVSTPSPPSAMDRYATAQTAYQSELDPAKNAEMNAIYAGASEMDKINISGNVMKRAAGLNRKPLLAAGTPARR